jgi:hypothetical protein
MGILGHQIASVIGVQLLSVSPYYGPPAGRDCHDAHIPALYEVIRTGQPTAVTFTAAQGSRW